MTGPLPSAAWVSCNRPDPAARFRLWCLPYAGGGASSWYPWAARLTGIAEIAALRPPGRESRLREPPQQRLGPLVEELFGHISPYLDRGYALAGHSLGAHIAFELARLAQARGRPGPAALIVSGARAPGTPRREPDLHGLPDAEFIEELSSRYEGIPAAIRSEPELLALLLPVMRADLAAYETHHHAAGATLTCPILAMGGLTDAHVAASEVSAWRAQTTGPFSEEFFPGGHFFIQTHLAAVTEQVRRFLGGF